MNDENMIANMHIGGIVSIWDLSEDGRVRIGVGQCKDPSLVPIYGVNGVENYKVITIIFVVEAFEQCRLFCLTSIAWYYESLMGNDCFCLARDISMLKEEFVFLLEKGIQEEGFNNLWKIIVSCRDHVLSSSLRCEGFDVDEEINNMMNDIP